MFLARSMKPNWMICIMINHALAHRGAIITDKREESHPVTYCCPEYEALCLESNGFVDGWDWVELQKNEYYQDLRKQIAAHDCGKDIALSLLRKAEEVGNIKIVEHMKGIINELDTS